MLNVSKYRKQNLHLKIVLNLFLKTLILGDVLTIKGNYTFLDLQQILIF